MNGGEREIQGIVRVVWTAPLPAHHNFRTTFGLSRPYRNFRKNFRESLVHPKPQMLVEIEPPITD